jgi:hypothetical protein
MSEQLKLVKSDCLLCKVGDAYREMSEKAHKALEILKDIEHTETVIGADDYFQGVQDAIDLLEEVKVL